MHKNEQLEDERTLSSYRIGNDSILHLVLRGEQSSNIVAGGYGPGSERNQLFFPHGLCVVDNQTIIVADWGNHRIVQWKINGNNGEVIAGGNGQGNGLNQLNCPTDVLINKNDNSLIISDHGNRRVLRWSLSPGTTQADPPILDDIACWGLSMDQSGCLYVSDIEKHEVKRYQYPIVDKNGQVVAGGHGPGARLKQLNKPTYISVDEQQCVYVSDTMNYRVIKWEASAEKGTLVFHGFPRGLFVDRANVVYAVDYKNHHVLCQTPTGQEKRIAVTAGIGQSAQQEFCSPWCMTFDQQNHCYISDHNDHRILCLPIA